MSLEETGLLSRVGVAPSLLTALKLCTADEAMQVSVSDGGDSVGVIMFRLLVCFIIFFFFEFGDTGK